MERIRNIVDNLLREFIKDVEVNALMQGKYATGKTIRSMEVRSSAPSDDRVSSAVYAAPYIWTLDTGSRPARRRGTDAERQAFISNLTIWCRNHAMPQGGLSEVEYRRFAKFLKWYIGKHGSWLYRHPEAQNKVIAPALRILEDNLTEQVANAFSDKLTAMITPTEKTIIL